MRDGYERKTDIAIVSMKKDISSMCETNKKILSILDGDKGLVADNRSNKTNIRALFWVIGICLSIGIPSILLGFRMVS